MAEPEDKTIEIDGKQYQMAIPPARPWPFQVPAVEVADNLRAKGYSDQELKEMGF